MSHADTSSIPQQSGRRRAQASLRKSVGYLGSTTRYDTTASTASNVMMIAVLMTIARALDCSWGGGGGVRCWLLRESDIETSTAENPLGGLKDSEFGPGEV